MDSDVARDRAADALAGLRDQMVDIAAMKKKRAALKVDGQAADDTVKVTVNAQGQLIKTLIDKSYLDDHDFEDLAGYVTEAAQAAAAQAERQVTEMMAPINERRTDRKLPSLSEIVEGGLPDPSDVMALGLDAFAAGAAHRQRPPIPSAGGIYDDGDDEADFPEVRR